MLLCSMQRPIRADDEQQRTKFQEDFAARLAFLDNKVTQGQNLSPTLPAVSTDTWEAREGLLHGWPGLV